jgi:hypothetical protein
MPDEFVDLLNLGDEMRSLEYKAAARFDQISRILTKAILGMSNMRDGGSIIIGLSERDDRTGFDRVGLTQDEVATYQPDNVKDMVDRYADPSCEFQVQQKEHEEITYIWLVVAEFREEPVLCKREWHDPDNPGTPPFLKRGALYTRALGGRPRTVEVSTVEEMREILRIAHLKKVRGFIEEATAAGLIIPAAPEERPTDAEAFVRQRGDLEE